MSDICEFCGSALSGGPGKGRPRKYCGDACRQAAHRRRVSTGAAAAPAQEPSAPPDPAAEHAGAPRGAMAPRSGAHGPSAGDLMLADLARDIQDGARDLARLLPSLGGEEPVRRVAQLQEQLDGLTAAVVGRARYRRVTWAAISSILRISEDTARHRYTDRYILRRLARFNRSQTALTTLAGLFGTAATGPQDTSAGSDGSSEAGDAGDRGEGPEQQSVPDDASGAAYNRLSPILSMLVRTAQLTNKEVSSRIGCSASYLSRILSGERVPTWELTRKFAQACGADPEVLRAVWETEKLRLKSSDRAIVPDTDGQTAAEHLRAAIRTLHLRAGRPTAGDIAVASRWALTAGAVASLLEATVLPPRGVLHTFVRLLGGDIRHFDQLLDNAHHEAAQDPAHLQPPARRDHTLSLERTPAPPARSYTSGPDTVLNTFSKILTEDHTVEDGRARLLHKRAEDPHPTDSQRRRPLTTLTDALRQRTPAPPATITPLGGT
ncbi:helix-turn-helix transcriptional regulator [Streptomyces sp. NPDC052012]|uniref:helix-turn-helix domain-containing protein n=1 Tax=Streptomyces sp. NPDC052012 TaxID=3155051 RepID=UPI00344BBB92